ncbi:MAG: hypothetical protein LBJ02_02010 [Bifidobacteriaceae bacterium]|jgi:hypothetical protein|nr:hypothetical protein [Bifidobacteriaceae bacterium]
MERWQATVVAEPLAGFRDGFAGWLVGRGYSLDSTSNLVGVMANLAKWMAAEGLGIGALRGPAAERFAAYRRSAGYTAWRTPKGLPVSKRTLLWVLSSGDLFELAVELADDVPLEAASGFAFGFALGEAFGGVRLGFGVVGLAGAGDHVDRGVEFPVTPCLFHSN